MHRSKVCCAPASASGGKIKRLPVVPLFRKKLHAAPFLLACKQARDVFGLLPAFGGFESTAKFLPGALTIGTLPHA